MNTVDYWQHLHRYGYAPGNYMGKCLSCGKIVEHLDKRASACRPCAEQRYNADQRIVAEVESKPQPELKVEIRSFPESNGKRNWTALLLRTEKFNGLVGSCDGISLAHGESWNRVAYVAERTKFLLGQRDTEPYILDYALDIGTPDEWKGENGRQHPQDV